VQTPACAHAAGVAVVVGTVSPLTWPSSLLARTAHRPGRQL
jgi:hypothetical protein